MAYSKHMQNLFLCFVAGCWRCNAHNLSA